MGDVVSSALDDDEGMRDDVSRGGSRPLLLGDVSGAAAAFNLPTGTVTFVLTDLGGLPCPRDRPRRWRPRPTGNTRSWTKRSPNTAGPGRSGKTTATLWSLLFLGRRTPSELPWTPSEP